MPRLSVDIDLVFTDLTCPDRESALAAIEHALHDVSNLLHSKLGVTVRPTMSGSDHESKLFISRGPVLLKVEVNHVFRGTVYPLVTGNLSAEAQRRFSRGLSIPMLDHDELYASKLVAALDRHTRQLKYPAHAELDTLAPLLLLLLHLTPLTAVQWQRSCVAGFANRHVTTQKIFNFA